MKLSKAKLYIVFILGLSSHFAVATTPQIKYSPQILNSNIESYDFVDLKDGRILTLSSNEFQIWEEKESKWSATQIQIRDPKNKKLNKFSKVIRLPDGRLLIRAYEGFQEFITKQSTKNSSNKIFETYEMEATTNDNKKLLKLGYNGQSFNGDFIYYQRGFESWKNVASYACKEVSLGHCVAQKIAGQDEMGSVRMVTNDRFISSFNSALRLWSLIDGKYQFNDTEINDSLTNIAALPNGMIVTSSDYRLKVWKDLGNSFSLVAKKEFEKSQVSQFLEVMSDGRILTISLSGDIRIWTEENGNLTDQIIQSSSDSTVRNFIKLSDGRFVVVFNHNNFDNTFDNSMVVFAEKNGKFESETIMSYLHDYRKGAKNEHEIRDIFPLKNGNFLSTDMGKLVLWKKNK